ncbi:MAG: class I SAM-dependent methyltransferase [Ferruginibacter sp.]
MNTQHAYNNWAPTYDAVTNKTRDLELIAGQQLLANADFSKVLELGCGTGKNTQWLTEKAKKITAVDFSEAMMNIARKKVNTKGIKFQQADITKPWSFKKATLITCSLILEHIENIDFIFEQAANTLKKNGCFYICELHPYKQLEGSRARFEKDDQTIHLEYFIHHISDFFSAASKNNLKCIHLQEWFDDDNRSTTPRLISFLFQKA